MFFFYYVQIGSSLTAVRHFCSDYGKKDTVLGFWLYVDSKEKSRGNRAGSFNERTNSRAENGHIVG